MDDYQDDVIHLKNTETIIVVSTQSTSDIVFQKKKEKYNFFFRLIKRFYRSTFIEDQVKLTLMKRLQSCNIVLN